MVIQCVKGYYQEIRKVLCLVVINIKVTIYRLDIMYAINQRIKIYRRNSTMSK